MFLLRPYTESGKTGSKGNKISYSPIKRKAIKVASIYLLLTTSFYLSGMPVSSLLHTVFAGPTSSTYELKDYSFGGGGDSVSSSNYQVLGSTGDLQTGQQLSSGSYKVGSGLLYTMMANVPPSPALSIIDDSYNKIHVVINTGSNPPDSLFAIAVSTDNFVSDTKYVQNDNTLSSSLGTEDWQDYSTWGGALGFNIIDLTPGTTYYIKVAAKRGADTESGFGPADSLTTSNSKLTFDIDVSTLDVDNEPPFAMNLGSLTAGSVITSPDKVWVDLTTNGVGGGAVYVYGTHSGLQSDATSYTISSVVGNLSSVSEGYGARGVSVTESSGGPVQISAPYNGAGDVVGPIDTEKRLMFDTSSEPVVAGRASFELKAKVTNVTPASSDYSDTITVIAASSF